MKTRKVVERGCGESMRVRSSDNCPDLAHHDMTMDEKWAKPQHTPGPWKVESYIFQDEKRLRLRKDTADGLASYIAEVCQEGTICEEHGGNPVANARLIAAAPDLLEAVKKSLEWFRKVPQYVDKSVHASMPLAELEQALHRAEKGD